MGVALLSWSVWMGGDVMAFVDYPSVAITIGGAVSSTLISFPMRAVSSMVKVMKQAWFAKSKDPSSIIADMVSYAEVARRDGILSLENMTKQIDDEFVVKGIQMAVDGLDPELIEQIMNSELDAISDRHAAGKGLVDSIAKYGPAYGMIGTLFGLIVMLKNMNDPALIGPGMATAVLTTLYGAVMANLLFGPVADKLGRRNDEEMALKGLVIRGVMSIQSGDNPRIVEQKLKTYLSPTQRAAMEAQKADKT